MTRKTFATTIDETLILNFKEACKDNKLKYNEVLEALMQAYIKKQVKVEVDVKTITNYKVIVKNGE